MLAGREARVQAPIVGLAREEEGHNPIATASDEIDNAGVSDRYPLVEIGDERGELVKECAGAQPHRHPVPDSMPIVDSVG